MEWKRKPRLTAEYGVRKFTRVKTQQDLGSHPPHPPPRTTQWLMSLSEQLFKKESRLWGWASWRRTRRKILTDKIWGSIPTSSGLFHFNLLIFMKYLLCIGDSPEDFTHVNSFNLHNRVRLTLLFSCSSNS